MKWSLRHNNRPAMRKLRKCQRDHTSQGCIFWGNDVEVLGVSQCFHVFSYFLEGHACLPVRTWSTFPVDFPYLSPLVSLLKTTKEDLDDFKVSHYFKKPAHGCRKAGGSLVLWSSNYSWEDVVSWTLLTCVCVGMCGGASVKCVVFNIRSGHFFWFGFPMVSQRFLEACSSLNSKAITGKSLVIWLHRVYTSISVLSWQVNISIIYYNVVYLC